MKMPKISVVMSVYNSEKYLRDSIDSILRQTFTDFEFIIINDGSTDNTANILNDYGLKDNRIKIINQDNMGLTKSLNKGIRLAVGEYIARMDSDDIASPARFSMQVRFLDNNLEIGLVGTNCYVIDTDNYVIGELMNQPCEPKDIRNTLIRHNIFCHSSLMIRAEVFQKFGTYNENYRVAQDYEFLLRVSEGCKLANLRNHLIAWRCNPAGTTFSKNTKQRRYGIMAQIKSIKTGSYHFYNWIWVIKSLATMIIPVSIKNYLRKKVIKPLIKQYPNKGDIFTLAEFQGLSAEV